MKPRIFIGSSSEGLNVAERVKFFFQNHMIVFYGQMIYLKTMNLS